jgi:hypothetical protein
LATGEVRIRHISRAQPNDTDIDEVFKTANFVYDEPAARRPPAAARYNTDPAAGKNGELMVRGRAAAVLPEVLTEQPGESARCCASRRVASKPVDAKNAAVRVSKCKRT